MVVPMGGATNVAKFVRRYAADGARVVGLCDLNEARHYRRVLGDDDIFVCERDLEDELIRALGPERVVDVLEANGDLATFRRFQNQPFQRDRPIEKQLHRFFGTTGGRKERYAAILVTALDEARVPRPLAALLTLG